MTHSKLTTHQTVRLYGQDEGQTASDNFSLLGGEASRLAFQASEVHGYALDPAGFRGGSKATDVEIPDDALVEVELNQGLKFWTVGKNLREHLLKPGSAGSRGLAEGEAWNLPSSLDTPGDSRGFGGQLVLKGLRWVGIDLEKLGRDKIIELAESRAVPREGLFLVGDDGIVGAPLTQPIPDGGPTLILLHGTASNTQGSFSRLWQRQKAQWGELRRYFGNRIYALEHATLTRSPIDNALAAAKLLPKSGKVSFLSHSRGGLVGEFLCLDPSGFDLESAKAGLDARKTADNTPENHAIESQKEMLEDLLKALRRPGLQIERFARVACPILGTSLIGEKLDSWGSLLVLAAVAEEMRQSGKRGFGLADIPGALVKLGLDTLGETVAGILASRKQSHELPGLEAMMPDSATVAILNANPGLGKLFVVAGDARPMEGDWLSALRFHLADGFYERDHDLVVDTRAMLDGPLRHSASAKARCRVQFRSGSDVNHFSYFGNQDSAEAIVTALTASPAPGAPFRDYFGQWPLSDPAAADARGWFSPTPAPDPKGADVRGTVVLVPGLCGSELLIDTREIWANLPALAGGAFLTHLDIDNKEIKHGQPLADSYIDLANALRKRGYKVRMHGYDWRKAIGESIGGLATTLDKELKEARSTGKPVHAIVHSMGGVLIRAVFAEKHELWTDWNAQPGAARVIMLGTPNQGSHAVTLLLTGRDRFFRQLSYLDLRHSQTELLEIASRFPGVLELLPAPNSPEDGNAVRDSKNWENWKKDDKADWPVPDEARLKKSADLWTKLKDDPLINSERLIYVAGVADRTPVGAGIDANGRFELRSTRDGDGRVTWATGIPQICKDNKGRTYYVNALHGDLPKTAGAFEGYLQLLEHGQTRLLPTQPPGDRSAKKEAPRPYLRDDADVNAALFPTRDDLLAAATGGSLPAASGAPEDYQAKVRVLHGDLLYAESPVLVGHMQGSNALEYTEWLLNRALDNRMGERLAAGLYPGELGSFAVFRPQGQDRLSQGAIVIGMGRIGELSAGQLALGVSMAIAAYALDSLDRTRDDAVGLGQKSLSLPVSALLIGSGTRELTLPDSVAAILRGHRNARIRLREAGLENAIRLDRLDIIEIMEDRAIQALTAARDAVFFEPRLRASFDVEDKLIAMDGGRRRAYAAAEEGFWQRININAVGEGADRQLLFDANNGLARGERSYNGVPLADIERFTSTYVTTEQDQERIGRCLFELLMPNWLKDQAPDRQRVQLVLDTTAASFPWEVLRDRAYDHDGDSRQPLSVRNGLVRQLTTARFREKPRPSTDFKAFVVGDPLLGAWSTVLPPLEGAKKEAEAVHDKLVEAGFTTAPALVRADGARVLLELFQDEWRLLHLSGHGVYQEDIPAIGAAPARGKATGMVIGEGMLLTPAHIEQMRVVPDFVFINCCTLGRIESDAQRQAPANDRPGSPRLAANLATQLIEMGVRAVIAAGWKVLDDAAVLFAETFYDRFLNREPFGESVLAARKQVFERFPASNTWGAYQCYGDPGFVLPRSRAAAARNQPKRYPFVSASEVICELDGLTLRAQARPDTAADAHKHYELYVKPLLELSVSKGWLDQGKVLEAFARLAAENNQHERAIDLYRQALNAADGGASLRAQEQLANMLARRAAACLIAGEYQAAKELLDEAERVLALKSGYTIETAERWALQGGIEKRRLALAIANGGFKDLKDALKAMQEAYSRADALAAAAGAPRYYHGLNVAFAAALRQLAGDLPQKQLANIKKSLTVIETELGPNFHPKDLWERVAPLDLQLAQWLMEPARFGNTDTIEKLGGDYAKLLESTARPRHRESVETTLRILCNAAKKLAKEESCPNRPAAEQAAKGLESLLVSVGQATG